MSRRSLSLLLDAAMLVTFVLLHSWRFTGVPLHEWLSVALAAALLLHLVVHWGWVTSRMQRLGADRSSRLLVNLLLNGALLVGMITAMVSGVMISKVVLPNALAPEHWLAWHGVHEWSSLATLVAVGLHVALNWDRVLSIVRRARGASAAAAARREPWPARSVVLRRTAGVLLVCTVVAVAARVGGGLAPDQSVTQSVDLVGHVSVLVPATAVTQLQEDTRRPNGHAGGARLLLRGLIIGGIALAGRWWLRLRLA